MVFRAVFSKQDVCRIAFLPEIFLARNLDVLQVFLQVLKHKQKKNENKNHTNQCMVTLNCPWGSV